MVITVGREIDPAELGPTPPHIRVERFVPQQFLLPRCNVVACHAGSGSVLGALAFGVPMLLLPMGADQPANADRCADLGVATMLDPLTVSPEQAAEAVRTLLTEPRFGPPQRSGGRPAKPCRPPDEAVRWIQMLNGHSSSS